MGLLDGMKPPTTQPCKIGRIAQELDDADRKIFLAAVMNKDWAMRPLIDELAKRGIIVGRDLLTRHRHGNCQCSKI